MTAEEKVWLKAASKASKAADRAKKTKALSDADEQTALDLHKAAKAAFFAMRDADWARSDAASAAWALTHQPVTNTH